MVLATGPNVIQNLKLKFQSEIVLDKPQNNSKSPDLR